MLLSTLTCASIDNDWCYDARSHYVIFGTCPPLVSGTYFTFYNDLKHADGTDIKVGDKYHPSAWDDDQWCKSHFISCEITDISSLQSDDGYQITVVCNVQGKIQFFRKNGTLKWSRDEVGYSDFHSDDIYNCYNKSGVSVVKRVNDPYYCK